MEKWFKRKYKVSVDNKMPYFGVTDTKKKTIKINKKKSKQSGQKGEVIDSIAHEINHALHPKASEKKVQKITAKQRLGNKTKSKLYKLINK